MRQTWGALLILVNTAAYGLFLVMFHRATRRKPYPFAINFWCTAAGTLIMVPIALPFFKERDWSRVPGQAWGSMVFAGVVCSGIGLSLNAWAVRHIQAIVPALGCSLQVRLLEFRLFRLGTALRFFSPC